MRAGVKETPTRQLGSSRGRDGGDVESDDLARPTCGYKSGDCSSLFSYRDRGRARVDPLTVITLFETTDMCIIDIRHST